MPFPPLFSTAIVTTPCNTPTPRRSSKQASDAHKSGPGRVTPHASTSRATAFIVENRPGAGTVIGVDAAAKSAPDGYTLVCVANSFTANATLVPKLPYDTLKDFRGVGMLVRTPQVLIGRTSLPAKDFRALVALAQSEPGRLNCGTPGNGTVQHLGFEVLKRATSIDVVHVPYKGGNQALTDVMSGNLDLAFVNLTTALPQILAGSVRSYGVASLQRSTLVPEMPTIAEQGLPGYESVAWFALMTQARVPTPSCSR